MKTIIAKLAMLSACVLLTACVSNRPLGPLGAAGGATSTVVLVDQAGLAAPTRADIVNTSREDYRIGAFDVLQIGVFGIDELETRDYRADGSGRISFPLLGSVPVAGLTPSQLEGQITEGLREQFIRDPRVTVNVKEAVSRTVTVSGQVERPGIYPMQGRMSLIRSVAVAGGMGDFAKSDEVVVFRTIGGQKMAAIYDLGAIQRGNYDDPEIFADDIVVVGDSPQKRLLRDAIGTAPAILSPLLVTIL